MSDEDVNMSRTFDAWFTWQSQLLKAQAPYWAQMTKNLAPIKGDSLSDKTLEAWDRAQRLNDAWWQQFGQVVAPEEDGPLRDVFQRIFDPGQLLFAGSDEVNRTLQKLVEGPELADIGLIEREVLKATSEWVKLRKASAEYRSIVGAAWMRAFERFNRETTKTPSRWTEGPTALLRRWLDIANDELIATQRTEPFLKAQRDLLRAGIDYRLRQRELVETWCETHSVPTRSEVDDLHGYVHRLKREFRSLRKEVETLRDEGSIRPSKGKSTKQG